MPIQKAIETPVTGAQAAFHVIASYTVDLTSNRSAVVVQSFYSQAARDAGRQAMHTWHISMYEVPPVEAPALGWFEQQLTAAEVPPENDPSYSMDPSRWVFAGGVVA